MMPRIAKGKSQPTWIKNQFFLTTESVGPNGDFIVLTGYRCDNFDIYMTPILESIRKPNEGSKLVDPNILDCRLYDPTSLYLRSTPELNQKIPLKNKPHLSRVGILAYPSKDNFQDQINENEFYLEEMFKEEVSNILKQHHSKQQKGSKFPSSISIKWKSLSTKNKYRSLDQILTDESVAQVIYAYFVTNANDSHTIYQKLQDCDVQDSFYSKHAHTRKYCKIAVDDFGFPEE